MHDWCTEPLANIAEIRTSNVDKKSASHEVRVRLCNYMDVYSREYITNDIDFMEATATTAEIQRFGVERGDVMITKDSETPDDIGIPAVVVEDIPSLVCGYHVALIKHDNRKINPIYLAKQLALSDTARYYGRLANGSTRYGLSSRTIAGTPIRLAPLPQQKRIAEILSTVDEAIEQTEALIAKTQKIKAGLMHDLFARGVTADGQLRPPREQAPELYKESPLGWIPKEWTVVPFGTLLKGTAQNGLYKPIIDYGSFGVSIVRIDSFYNGAIFEVDNLKRLNISRREEVLYGLAVGDILINRVNSIDYVGKSAIVPRLFDRLVFESNIMRCSVQRDCILPEYAIKWLCGQAAVGHFRLRAKSAVAQASINQQDVACLPVPLTSTDEQQRIIHRIATIDEFLESHQADLNKLTRSKFGLMKDILTGHVSVAVEDPSDRQPILANV